MAVPLWQVVFPLGALALLGYTVYVNVVPYPTEARRGGSRWSPAAMLVLAVILVLSAPGFARRVGERLTTADGGA